MLAATRASHSDIHKVYKVPSERGRAEFHIDTLNKTNGAKIAHRKDDQVFRRIWLMLCSNLGQTYNNLT